MSSGQRSIVINPQERAVSLDINRLQSLAAKGALESLRFLLDVSQGTDDAQAGGIATEYLTTGTPTQAEILGGLMVVPQNGTLALGVTDGIALLINPDASPTTDDSPYKTVQDAGGMPVCFNTVGNVALTMTANSSGSIRVDVIECQRQQDPNPETDSRDIFNPTTALFTATTVTKTTGDTMLYRVRAGTPGAGFPGVVSGWLPLTVASVPTGTTTNDTITFWDVRPLISDRPNGSSNQSYDLPRRTTLHYSTTATGAVGVPFPVSGVAEVINQGRRVGGRLLSGAPDSNDSNLYVDFVDPDNQESGFGTSGSGIAYFYFLTPFGLPRWALYSNATSGVRYPRSPRGIPIVSKSGPRHAYGYAAFPIVLPAVYGFAGVSVAEEECAYFGATTYLTATGPSVFFNLFSCTDGWTTFSRAPSVSLTPATTPTTTTGTFTLTEDADIPSCCKKLRCTLTVPLTTATVDAVIVVKPEFTLTLPSGQSAYAQPSTQSVYANTGAAFSPTLVWTFEIDVPDNYPVPTVPQTYTLSYSYASSTHATFTNPTLQILGWQT